MRRNAYNPHFDVATAFPTLVFIEPFSLKTRNAKCKSENVTFEIHWYIWGFVHVSDGTEILTQANGCLPFVTKSQLRPRADQKCFVCFLARTASQGGRSCASARAALTERSGSSTKGRTPNIRCFVAKLSNVAIYALFERHSQGFQRKPSCFRRPFNENHPAFVEL